MDIAASGKLFVLQRNSLALLRPRRTKGQGRQESNLRSHYLRHRQEQSVYLTEVETDHLRDVLPGFRFQ